jgi:DedD protein
VAKTPETKPAPVKAEAKPVIKPAEVKFPDSSPNGFTVQVGVFSDAANVKQLQDKLKQAGFSSYTEKISTPNGQKIRLRAGKFATRQEASDALNRIKSAGLSGMVISN